MNDETLEQVLNKRRMLRELHRARIRVQQLERQLRGETPEFEHEPVIPSFLTLAPPAETSSCRHTTSGEYSARKRMRF